MRQTETGGRGRGRVERWGKKRGEGELKSEYPLGYPHLTFVR